MITKNGYKLLAAAAFCNTLRIKVKDISGADSDVLFVQGSTYTFPFTNLGTGVAADKFFVDSSYSGVWYSSDDTDPSVDDYTADVSKLFGSEISISTTRQTVNTTEDVEEAYSVHSLTNVSKSSITINSLYYCKTCFTGSGYKLAVLDHTKLASPITIQPNETKSFTYAIKFNLGA